MKKNILKIHNNIFIFIVFILSIQKTEAKSIITGEVKNYDGTYLTVRKPIKGYFNNLTYESNDTVQLKNNRFSIEIPCQRAVFVTMIFSGNPVQIIVQPNDSVSFTLDFSGAKEKKRISSTFYGANAPGNSYFYNYNYQPSDKYKKLRSLLNTTSSADIEKLIKDEIKQQLVPFNLLYYAGQIDSSYHRLMTNTITSLLLFEAIRRLANPNLTNFAIPFPARAAIADRLFDLFDPYHEDIYYGLNTSFYTDLYVMRQRAKTLNAEPLYTQPDTTIFYQNRNYTITGAFASMIVMKDKGLKEFLLGSKILNGFSVSAEGFFKDEVLYFSHYFAKSPYTQIMNAFQRSVQINKETAIASSSFKFMPANILDSTATYKDLEFTRSGVFKDQLVFIDLWATWCGPCIKEMQFNYALDSFLYANNILRLNVSIDNQADKDKWSQFVREKHLSGYNILASKELKDWLVSKLEFSDNLISIPRYLIIKNNEILNKDAYRPSEYSKLFNQLTEISLQDSK